MLLGKNPYSFSRRGRRGFTLTEIVFASAISALVTIPIMATFMYVIRTQVTVANIILARERAASVIARLAQDVRNTSCTVYNGTAWPRMPLTPGPNDQKITVLDSVNGWRIQWLYNPSTKRLTRITLVIDAGTGDLVEQSREEFSSLFQDFKLEEIAQTDMQAKDPNPDLQFDTSNVAKLITYKAGIRVIARVFISMDPTLSVLSEVDGNNDGDFGNDKVRRDVFGKSVPNPTDNPGWQQIFNVRTTFRNG